MTILMASHASRSSLIRYFTVWEYLGKCFLIKGEPPPFGHWDRFCTRQFTQVDASARVYGAQTKNVATQPWKSARDLPPSASTPSIARMDTNSSPWFGRREGDGARADSHRWKKEE